ncbi:hypothetical protein [Paraburkholderia sp. J8-2]|uniref:hypothetical protein n=1 Tax=Paraburkholderia sp. J8-2 TaxID=2805440 RepID=UPI002AB697DB|nr:hypothetical protein [Paraburkholderia sp. J8-2]
MLKKFFNSKSTTRFVAMVAWLLNALARVPTTLMAMAKNTSAEVRFVVVTVVPTVVSYMVLLRSGHAFAPGPFEEAGGFWATLNALAGTNSTYATIAVAALVLVRRLREMVRDVLVDHYKEIFVLEILVEAITGRLGTALHEAMSFVNEKIALLHSLGAQTHDALLFMSWASASAVGWYFATRLYFPERFEAVKEQPAAA